MFPFFIIKFYKWNDQFNNPICRNTNKYPKQFLPRRHRFKKVQKSLHPSYVLCPKDTNLKYYEIDVSTSKKIFRNNCVFLGVFGLGFLKAYSHLALIERVMNFSNMTEDAVCDQ